MKENCIFRVWGRRHWYRVYLKFVLGVGNVYEVYRDRRHIAGIWRYVDFDEAANVALALAKKDVYLIKDGEEIL